METQLRKLMKFYGMTFKELAVKIGVTERHLYNIKKGKYVSRWLKEKINNMVKAIEAL